MIDIINAHPTVAAATVVVLLFCLRMLSRSDGATLWGVLPEWTDITTWSRYGLVGTVGQLLVTSALAGGAVLSAGLADQVLTLAEWQAAGQAVLEALGIVTAVKHLSPGRAKRKQLERLARPETDKILEAMRKTGTAAIVLLALFAVGCAGSLEEAKLAGLDPQMRAAAPAPSERCQQLDNEQRWLGGASKGLAFLGGASGVATWPVESKDAQVGLAIGAGVSAAGAIVTEYIADGARDSWARECAWSALRSYGGEL